MIEVKNLDDEVKSYTVSNGKISFSAMNYGCTISNLFVPDKNGKPVDILLGYDSLEEWKKGSASHNAVVGRVANRIRGAKFSLDGKEYLLDKNDGENCLHSGNTRYEKMLWQGETFSDSVGEGVRFTRKSADGEQGFPGNLDLCVTYTLTEKNELIIEEEAVTDKATPINLIHHGYYNLDGCGNVLNHHLQLDCKNFLEGDDCLIPTGKILSVEGTPFDFTKEKTVGFDIQKLASGNVTEETPFGYDHCFVTCADEKEPVRFGEIWSEKTGIKMEMFTNQRGVHVYTGNFLSGTVGKGGVVHKRHDGICFETERFPNSINEPSFPTCVLKPGEKYHHKTIFKFTTR